MFNKKEKVNQEVQLKEVIITTLTRRGKGTEEDPIRAITEIWDKDTGEKIVEIDPDLPRRG